MIQLKKTKKHQKQNKTKLNNLAFWGTENLKIQQLEKIKVIQKSSITQLLKFDTQDLETVMLAN